MIVIDLYYLMEILLPPFLRGINMMSLLIAALKPLVEVQQNFYQFFGDKKYELSFNGQVIYLEHILNDQFDSTLRRIYIDDAEQSPTVYLFNESEDNEETYLFNNSESVEDLYLFNSSVTYTDFDFIVFVPIGLIYDENLMKYYINKYRCAGKRFKIQEI